MIIIKLIIKPVFAETTGQSSFIINLIVKLSEGNIMWTVIYMAKSKESILKVQEILACENLAVRVRPVGAQNEDSFYEILVPETEAQLAHSILISNGY